MPNYVEVTMGVEPKQKHIEQGQIAVLIDAIGGHMVTDTMVCHIQDPELILTTIHTILLIDQEGWVRSLPTLGDTRTDPYTMRFSPTEGINIVFDRLIMTPDGLILRKEFPAYVQRKHEAMMMGLSESKRLFVMNPDK